MSETVRKRKNYGVSPERFIETWQKFAKSGGSADDVAKELGMEKNIVLARKSNYTKPRKNGAPGVNLLPMKRNNPRALNIVELNKFAQTIADAPVVTPEVTA